MEIQLADALKALRQELSRSIKESEGEAVRFRIERINLEAQVAVTAGREGRGRQDLAVLGRRQVVQADRVHPHAHAGAGGRDRGRRLRADRGKPEADGRAPRDSR
ncbi:trypco2 family protein [Nonomuraea antimicrobica]